jgi:hypothetical protein
MDHAYRDKKVVGVFIAFYVRRFTDSNAFLFDGGGD